MNAIVEELRRIADIADAGDKPHWASAMRAGALQIATWEPEIERARARAREDADSMDVIVGMFDREEVPFTLAELRRLVARVRDMRAIGRSKTPNGGNHRPPVGGPVDCVVRFLWHKNT